MVKTARSAPKAKRRTTPRILRSAAAAIAAVSLAAPAWAGLFTVTPVRIFMTPRDRAIAVTITNDGDEELVMQADVYSWSQRPGGEDVLALSEDLILSPPILKMAPKSRQVVRLALINRAVLDNRQATYRLVVREVPEVKQADKNIQMQVALAFSMPVFITPAGAKRQLECSAARSAPEAVKVSCENKGSAYAQVRDVNLHTAAGEKLVGRETGGYILPGIARTFDLRRSEGAIAGGKYRLAVTLDDGTAQSYEVTVPE